MPRIQPVEPDNAPEQSRELMEQGEQAAGQMLNYFKQMAVSPASFKAYMEFEGALQGAPSARRPTSPSTSRPRITTAAPTDCRSTPPWRSKQE